MPRVPTALSLLGWMLLALPGCANDDGETTVATHPTYWEDPSESTSALPKQELYVYGWGTISDHECPFDDALCMARITCERVAGVDCIQTMCTCDGFTDDCFYPETMTAPPAVSFLARNYTINNIGNICACDLAALEALGLAAFFDSCGKGLWTAITP